MGFFKKLGKAIGKVAGKVEKATRPFHGVARTVASTAANVVAPGSGQLVHAFTGGNRGASVTAGGVGGMLPELGRITGINVAEGRPFNFTPPQLPGNVDPRGAAKAAAEKYRDIGNMVLENADRFTKRASTAVQTRRQTVGYQGDSPPLMSSHGATPRIVGTRTKGGGIVTANGVVYPKRRRMNPLNLRALRRGVARARSFEKIARKVVNLNVNKKFKKGRRRR